MDRGFTTKWSLGLGPADGGSSSSSARGPNGGYASRTRDDAPSRGPNGSVMANRGRGAAMPRSKAMAANPGNIVLGPGNNVLKGLGAGSNGGAAAPSPPPARLSYSRHQSTAAAAASRSNRSVSFAPAAAPPAQAWPQLNSSTLGTFQQPPPPSASSIVRSPSSEVPPSMPTSPQSAVEPPRGFEDNFPVLAGPKSAGPLSPALDRPTPIAWGKPNVVAKVAAPPPPKPKDVTPELEFEDLYTDPAEAAEIARLRALVPKLNAPKPGKPGPRERSKSMSTPKTTVVPAKPIAPKVAPPPRPAPTKPVVAPVFIANRPKLRSSMKASPPNKPSAVPPSEIKPPARETMRKSDSGVGGWLQSETSSESGALLSQQSGESLSQRSGRSPSVSSGAGSERGREQYHVRATSSSASPGASAETFTVGDAGVFDASFENAGFGREEEEDVFEEEEDEVRSQASSVTDRDDGFGDADEEGEWEREVTVIGEPRPQRAPQSPHLSSERSSSRGTSPVSRAPSTPAIDSAPNSEHDEDALKTEYGARADPYASTFQYSASLEKEEQFLRSLGWDKSAYYDSDVDESEFVITDEETREFWDG
ncbi:hypothetical protein HDV00_002099, partial [Rhizophlyctis rosea]